jgi:uncharacterized membrane-anchored protein YjiN (DUF445 family)
MTSAPPGWKPHQIVTRVDGWIIDPKNEDRIPAAVAEIISRAIGQVDGDTVADIRARMLARHKQVIGYA